MSVVDPIRRMAGLRKELFVGGEVLDIGCGDRKRGSVGVDIQPTASADAVADGTALPFAESSFEAVVCYHLIEHLNRQAIRELLAEIRRVMQPGGRAHLLVDRDESRPALLEKDPTHVERYDPEAIKAAVGHVLAIDVFQTHNLIGNVHNHPLRWWRLVGEGTKIYIEAVKS